MLHQELKKEIAAEVKKVLPKGWKVSFKVEYFSTLICTVREMPKTDLQALGHEVSRKDVLRRHVECDNPQDTDFYFNRFVFEDYDRDEFYQEFHIAVRAKGKEYVADDFDHVFASGQVAPRNPTNDRQRAMVKNLVAIVNAMAFKNYNESDIMSDYFDIGYGMQLNFGSYGKPCKLI